MTKRVPDSLNTLDAAKEVPWQGLIIFHHPYFGYVAVPAETATPEELAIRKANGWSANTYIPADKPGLATRMTLGHLVDKVESLERCYTLDMDTIQKQKEKITKLEKALMRCAAQAGRPNAAEGCRLIVDTVKEAIYGNKRSK